MSDNGWEKFKDTSEIRDLWTQDLAASSQVLPVCLFFFDSFPFESCCWISSQLDTPAGIISCVVVLKYLFIIHASTSVDPVCSFCAHLISLSLFLESWLKGCLFGFFLFGFVCYNGCTIILIKGITG